MRYVRLVVIAVLLFCVSVVPVFATTLDVPYDLSDNQNVIDKAKDAILNGDDLITVLDVKASPVTPSTSSGFHRVMITLLGNYEPITVDYTYQTSSSYLQHSITTDPDWSWICSAAIFGLVVFCVFRIIGGVLKSNG